MQIEPTVSMPNLINPQGGFKSYLTISVVLPDGHTPISSFRGTNVGVGGRYSFSATAFGEPVRRATPAELRAMDRYTCWRLLRQHPTGRIVVRRSRHAN